MLLGFNPKQYGLRAPAGPYRSELVAALEPWLQKHAPDKLRSELQTIFAKHPGWRLLFTPPYTPVFQPIELLWRHSKSAVASDWFEGRKLLEVYECIIRSWYGGKKCALVVFRILPSVISTASLGFLSVRIIWMLTSN